MLSCKSLLRKDVFPVPRAPLKWIRLNFQYFYGELWQLVVDFDKCFCLIDLDLFVVLRHVQQPGSYYDK